MGEGKWRHLGRKVNVEEQEGRQLKVKKVEKVGKQGRKRRGDT